MNKKLYLNFFDKRKSTDSNPFEWHETIEYQTTLIPNYQELRLSDEKNYIIDNKSIKFDKNCLIVNSKIHQGSFSIELKVNDFKVWLTLNIKETPFSGSMFLNKNVGFHYSLID